MFGRKTAPLWGDDQLMGQAVTSSGLPHPAAKARSGRAPRRTWVSGAVALGLFVSLAVAVELSTRPYFDWDLAVSHTVQSAHWPGLTSLMHGVSLADNNVLGPTLLVSGACLVLVARRAWREAVVLLGVVLVGQVLWVVSGQLVGRPRPTSVLVQIQIEEKDIHGFPSFPSGHAVYYTVFFGFLWFLAFTKVKRPVLRWSLLGVFGGLVPLVGFARLYLGAHWVSDVVGGYLLGGAVLAPGINLYRRWSSQAVEQTKGKDPGTPEV
jgi:undecaprenyl-diphosphatase